MKDYLNCDHMELDDTACDDQKHYYLPHHGVVIENSTTTKLRTFFK